MPAKEVQNMIAKSIKSSLKIIRGVFISFLAKPADEVQALGHRNQATRSDDPCPQEGGKYTDIPGGPGWARSSREVIGTRLAQVNLKQLFPVMMVLIHVIILVITIISNSIVLDEVGHIASGIYIYKTGNFDLYKVNPPLVRMIAALPVVLVGPQSDWSSHLPGPMSRPEWAIGLDFIAANRDSWFSYFIMARLAVIPISVIGAYICYRWSYDLFGYTSACFALTLWCLSPNVIAWASTITPDVGAASFGGLAAYCYWRWLTRATWSRAFVAGIALGLAELTKLTWTVLYGLWPALWLARQMADLASPRGPGRSPTGGDLSSARSVPRLIFCRYHELAHLAVILVIALYVVNAGYGFEGSFSKFGELTFVSKTLAGDESITEGGHGGNRFAGTWMGMVPLPLPENYVTGADLQKVDFETGKWSYLRGEWKHGGWWYYYLYAAIVKVPLGTIFITLMSLYLFIFRRREYSPGWRDELVLILPALAVFMLVSSQTGFNRYFRYVLPCYPFALVFISRVGKSIELGHRVVAILTATAMTCSAWASINSLPHCMSYFNSVAGGVDGGHYHLIDANVDWGQNLVCIKKWYDQHPEARPFFLASKSLVEAEYYGMHAPEPPTAFQGGPSPGWHVISFHRLHERDKAYEFYLNHLDPIDTICNSAYVYHVTEEQSKKIRDAIEREATPRPNFGANSNH